MRETNISTDLGLGLGLGFVESPAQSELGARDDEGHPEDIQTSVRINGERRRRDWTGTRTHIVHREQEEKQGEKGGDKVR
jgi:hypothetical protein